MPSTNRQAPDRFQELIQLVADLRGKNGCPWDKEQTHQSLAPFAIEEACELAEAIGGDDDGELQSELGDVLFQVMLHSQIASETGRFDVNDVINVLTEKMIRRHPHVFSDVKVSGSEDVLANWEEIKAEEKRLKGLSPTKEYLNTPKGLPALMEAKKIGSKTKKVGFDWSEASQVLVKVKEELAELEEALIDKDTSLNAVALEIGDCLFSLAQLARHLKIDAEQALRLSNQKFRQRFRFMIDASGGDVDNFASLSPAEKESLWVQAKEVLVPV